jgi:hypothetical protein
MHTELVVAQPKDKMQGSTLRLLKAGRPVVLAVHDPLVTYKKRIGSPAMLYINPVRDNEEGNQCFMFSMPGYGCEVMCVGSFKVSLLLRVGLPIRAAKILVAELTELFQ